MFSLEEVIIFPVPEEIILKIIMYAHPILNKNIQNDILEYTFCKNRFCNKRKYINCLKCNRFHRRPMHFYC